MGESVEITGVDLVKMVKKAYELSVPIGLGFLHYIKWDKLSTEEASCYIRKVGSSVVHLDYIKGRACKLYVYVRPNQGEKLFTDYPWFNHTHMQFIELLRYAHSDFESIKRPGFHEHRESCLCDECRVWALVGLKENVYGI